MIQLDGRFRCLLMLVVLAFSISPHIRKIFLLPLYLWGLSCAPALAGEPLSARFIKAAVALENPDIRYDSAYRRIAYPMGDVAADRGVCADVVVRAYRAIGRGRGIGRRS